LHVLVISSRVSVGTLTQAVAYTTFNKHDLIDVDEQLETLRAYVSTLRSTWNPAECNNARDRKRNFRYIYRGNFRKCQPITKHPF